MTRSFGAKLRSLIGRRKEMVPHVCWCCRWFRARKPKGNRYCLYPGKIMVTQAYPHKCLSWVREPDDTRRVPYAVEL